MNEYELKRLCERAAWTVTGKNVTIRLEHPITKQFDGEVYHSPGGGYVVNINPELSEEQFMWVFCHELGHVQLEHVSDISPDRKPSSMYLTPAGEMSLKVKPEIIACENAAQGWGDKWLHYAEENYHAYSGFTKVERQLRSLCGYVKPEYLEHARHIAWKAGLKAVEMEMWKRNQLMKGR